MSDSCAGVSNSGATVLAHRPPRRHRPGSWSGTMKRIVSLWFPKLSTDRLARVGQSPTPRDWSARAAATVVWRDGCRRLAAINAHARTAGLRAHMRLADARALVPDLITTAGDPQADRRLIESIANW